MDSEDVRTDQAFTISPKYTTMASYLCRKRLYYDNMPTSLGPFDLFCSEYICFHNVSHTASSLLDLHSAKGLITVGLSGEGHDLPENLLVKRVCPLFVLQLPNVRWGLFSLLVPNPRREMPACTDILFSPSIVFETAVSNLLSKTPRGNHRANISDTTQPETRLQCVHSTDRCEHPTRMQPADLPDPGSPDPLRYGLGIPHDLSSLSVGFRSFAPPDGLHFRPFGPSPGRNYLRFPAFTYTCGSLFILFSLFCSHKHKPLCTSIFRFFCPLVHYTITAQVHRCLCRGRAWWPVTRG